MFNILLKSIKRFSICLLAFGLIAYTSCISTMTIIFILSNFPELSETFVLNQMTGLIDRGHNVYICATQWGNLSNVHPDVYKYNLLDKTYVDYEKKRRLFTRVPYDIIYCHFGHNGLKGIRWIDKLNSKKKLVTVFHGFDISKLLNSDPDLYKDLFKRMDLALPISTHWEKKIIEMGLEAQKTIVHHMGVDCNTLDFAADRSFRNPTIRILSVARLTEKKGIKYGIRAIADILKHRNNIQYTIIGDGPLRQRLKKIIKRLGLENHIHLLGPMQHDKVIEYMEHSHILLAPSVTGIDGNQEGIPVVIMEAMSLGLPIVSTVHSGIPELVIDGRSGFLVPERDIDSLADKLLYLIEHPDLCQHMGQAGRDYVKHYFNIDRLNDTLVNIFTDLLKQ